MTQKTEKIDVEYLGAESRRTPGLAVDYMLAIVPGEEEDIELYAEAPTVRGEETATYEGLRAEIRRQAEDAGIDPGILAFPYDGGAREQLPQDVLADIDAYDPEHEELFYRIEGF